jgi:phosphate transport system permease protein
MNTPSPELANTLQTIAGAMRARLLKDWIFRQVMSLGGISVIVAISLIFFYLAWVAWPLVKPVQVDHWQVTALPAPEQGRTLHFSAEEQREIGARYTDGGSVVFFDLKSGAPRGEVRLPIPAGVRITSFAAGDPSHYVNALGLSDGRVLVLHEQYKVEFDAARQNQRVITPSIAFPLGETPLVLDERGGALRRLAVASADGGTTLAAQTEDGRILVASLAARQNMVTGETTVERSGAAITDFTGPVDRLIVEIKQRELYIAHGGRFIRHYDITDKGAPRFVQEKQVVPEGETMTTLEVLSGGFSLIVGTDRGRLAQWFLVRDAENKQHLTRIREFKPMPAAVKTIAPEYFRKGFLVGDAQGNVGLYYATSQRLLWEGAITRGPVLAAALPPRANGLMVEGADGRLHTARVENEHPEVSFYALWQPVWYESYEKPDYIWQSAAATNDFEPKFSLAPLTLGTLKAAFYAMLLATPLAIFAAIYSAYFMSPRTRRLAKPTIEIMEALPTVILGFLAGLWLAPLVENNLLGTAGSFLTVPIAVLVAAFLWHRLPAPWKSWVPAGWEAMLLLPVVALGIWLAYALGHPLEARFFGGDLPHWLNLHGITYEQRNSLVVGLAMGFAVTPTIFSIAEDAIFSVPKHLTAGSLALGATVWQTLKNVVLLTASPGIFSAVMIGMGRAVGETMIVLMATGNTAVMDWSIFTGFRTLAANIGVEMPEAAVGTTHFRLLFVSALVLFGFTFAVNTGAELIRQRLRNKYTVL